jgi:hypothetical protein
MRERGEDPYVLGRTREAAGRVDVRLSVKLKFWGNGGPDRLCNTLDEDPSVI